MEIINQYHEIAATAIARIFLGILFFFQGYDAVFNIKIRNIIQATENALSSKGIPRFLIVCGSWFTSYAELIGGAFLMFGLFEYFSLYLLGIDLIVASIAFSIVKPMWDMCFVFPRLTVLIFLLAVPHSWNLFSLDYLLTNIKN